MRGSERFLRAYACGDHVFREGDLGTEMFVVVSGAIEICRGDDADAQVLTTLRVGDMFGEMALVSEGRRSASARASQEGTRLICIDQARFVYLVSQQPAFALSVIRVLAQRLANASMPVFAPPGTA